MALYQPSNITPSTFAGIGGGIVDANDNVSISWQVNGNSVMTKFDIQVLTNETTPQNVHTFNVSGLSFHGTDKKGNPVFYVFEPGVTWESVGLENGNEYRLIIVQYWNDGTEKSVIQYSPSVFSTRDKPVVSISPSSSTLSSVSQTFTGTYTQEQGDSIAWARWILKDSNDEVLDDTGVIYTSVLSYSYDGLFNGETYTLDLIVESENGVIATATGIYPVSYISASALGNIVTKCNPDDSVTLEWAKALDIPGTLVDEGMSTENIDWRTVNGDEMYNHIVAPWQIGWKGKIKETYEAHSQTVTPSSEDDWELVRMYDSEATAPDTVSISNKDFERDYTKDPTSKATVPITFNPQTDHKHYTDIMRIDSTYISPYQSKIAGTVKATSRVVFEKPVDFSSPDFNLQFPGQHFYNFTPNWYVDPTPTGVVSTEYSERLGRYVDVLTVTFIGRINNRNMPMGMDIQVCYDYYEQTVDVTIADDDARDFALVSSTAYNTSVDFLGGNQLRINVMSKTSGPVSVVYSYKTDYVGDDAYYATVRFNSSVQPLVSASVTGTTAPGGAVISDVTDKRYTVTVYAPSPQDCTVDVNLVYIEQVIGAESYRWKALIGHLHDIVVPSLVITGNFSRIEPVALGDDVYLYVYNDTPTTSESITWDGLRIGGVFSHFFSIRAYGWLYLDGDSDPGSLILKRGNTVLTEIDISAYPTAYKAFVNVTQNTMLVVLYDSTNQEVGVVQGEFSGYTQVAIENVQLNTYDRTSDGDLEFLAIDGGIGANISDPVWSATMMFLWRPENEDYQAGTLTETASLAQSAVYRKEGTKLYPLGVYPYNSNGLTDYAIKSNREFSYMMYYIADGKYSSALESDTVCRKFRQYTLIEAETREDGTYKPIKVWRFSNNIDGSAISNNNSPTTLANFTRYPMWQPSVQSPRSGTLSALLGRFSQGQYGGDTADEMNRLYEISHSDNTFFLKDMKGNLFMVKPNGAISQKVNDKSGMLEVTVSVPWIEVGDASNAVILGE